MKVAVVADGHLFQTFIDEYDFIADFQRVLTEISSVRPDLLLFAGDFFDAMKSLRTYVRHYEGEGYTVKIREALLDFGLPIHAIRGNHEKKEILVGLDQTVENFHYAGDNWLVADDCAFFLMDTRYETGWYSTDALEKMSKRLSSESKKQKGKKTALICHETIAQLEDSVPIEIVKSFRKCFHWILNGHMHYFDQEVHGLTNVISLPSLLPSRLAIGKYWIEQYDWLSEDLEPRHVKRDSPFGYITIDTNDEKLELHRFSPSKMIVEVRLDLTGLSLQKTRERLRSLLQILDSRTDKKNLIVMPEIYGQISFSPFFLKDLSREYPDLCVETIRSDKTIPKAVVLAGKTVAPPILTIERLLDEMDNLSSEISARIRAKAPYEIDEDTTRTLIQNLLKPEYVQNPSSRLKTKLTALFDETLRTLSQNAGIKEPEGFVDNLGEIMEKIRR